MHNCDKVLEHLYEYIHAHDITSELTVEIRRHLECCRGCYTRYEFEQKLLVRLKKAGGCSCPESLKKRIQKLVENF